MFERELVNTIINRMNEPRQFIQVIVGPRQTGKTTAVTQALDSIQSANLYVSADDPAIISPEWLSSTWQQARMLLRDHESAILAIDEIQKLPNWAAHVKTLWDEDTRNRRQLKVILTGSSSLLLQQGTTESLAGRFELLRSPHWSFAECREAFGFSLDDFLFFGGYPGAAALRTDLNRWVRYLGDSIVEPTLSRDVLDMESIRKPALLRSLLQLGARYSGQELSYTKMLGQLQDAGNTTTLANYLNLLDKAGMMAGLPKYSTNPVQVRGSSPRLMVHDTSLMTYAFGSSRNTLLSDPEQRGHLVESAVGAYLLARSRSEDFEVHWWRERSMEVDFVLSQGDDIVAIEVKSGRNKRIQGLNEFLKTFTNARGLLIGDDAHPLADFLTGQIPLF